MKTQKQERHLNDPKVFWLSKLLTTSQIATLTTIVGKGNLTLEGLNVTHSKCKMTVPKGCTKQVIQKLICWKIEYSYD